MVLALAQAAESADDYDSATIALFVVFIVALIVTAGLVLREIMFPNGGGAGDSAAWLIPERPPIDPGPPVSLLPLHERHRLATAQSTGPTATGAPAWFSQAMSSQQHSAAQGITRGVERLIDASNRGDLRAGFACYTPEHLARYQYQLGIDAGELERMSRMQPMPATHHIAVVSVREVTIDPPYRAFATVDYEAADGSHRSSERYRFLFDRTTESWLVDAIETLPN